MAITSPWILGISASHNGSACLLHGDQLVVGVQEERLIRQKRARVHAGHPFLALEYCLESAGIGVKDLNGVVVCGQMRSKAPEQSIRSNPALHALPPEALLTVIPHHYGHAVAAFATSGLDDAAILIVDGLGSPYEDLGPDEQKLVKETVTDGWETISLYETSPTAIAPLEKHMVDNGRWLGDDRDASGGLPHFGSLGGMYGAVGKQIFGDSMDGPGKVMGLAPYGRPTIPPHEFFELQDGVFVYRNEVRSRFPYRDVWPARRDEYQDLAASVQVALEEALLHLAKRLRHMSASRNLCFAGGVALNSVANERIVREAGFDHVFFMPAAEDSGTAIGAAYHGLWKLTGRRTTAKLSHDAVGRSYSSEQISNALARTPRISVTVATDVVRDTVDRICDGRIVGWFDGRSELGPRALGQRSILCDPRLAHMKDQLNATVKHREGFRPFAPIVLLEEANNWFDLDGVTPESPYMLRVASFRKGKDAQVPAVAHVDGTGRVQTVTESSNGLLYAVVREFHRRTGVPIVLNTSFNVAGEPIVETPDDALWCLLYTGVDCCVMGGRLVEKAPGYTSILDLTPCIAATWVSVSYPVTSSGLDLSLAGASNPPMDTPFGVAADAERLVQGLAEKMRQKYVRFRVNTPWGPVSQFSETDVLSILECVDGRRTGRQMFDMLAARGQMPHEEAGFVRKLGRLYRARILSPVG